MRFTERFYRLLSSKQLPIWLITALIILVLLSHFIPQRKCLTGEEYNALISEGSFLYYFNRITGFDDVYSSPPFILIIALLFINLTFCMINRLRAILRVSLKYDTSVFFSAKTACPCGVL
ncbi:MAG: cytochrome c biogenesis protein ResB [bacterium]